LTAIVADAATRDHAMLVLEQDDTLVVSDRAKLLYRATREAGCPDLRYEHRRAAVDQLLALPDAIAWCWAKGGDVLGEGRRLATTHPTRRHARPRSLTEPEQARSPSATVVRPGLGLTFHSYCHGQAQV